jgi:hypothetical protein
VLLLIVLNRVYHVNLRHSFLMKYVNQYKAPVTSLVREVWQDHKLVAIIEARCHNIEDVIVLIVLHHVGESLVRAKVDRLLRR